MLRTARHIALLLLVSLVSMGVRVGAFSDWTNFCGYWASYYGCSCSGSNWEKVIHCNFPDENDEWQDLYQDLSMAMWDECQTYCEGGAYANKLAQDYQKDSSCFLTWFNTAGQGSPEDSWARCDCSFFDLCPPASSESNAGISH